MSKRIGFIGLGNIGLPMAANIAKAGFDLTVYDIRAEPIKELTALGARAAQSVVDLGAGCDQIHVIVLNDAQLEAVVMGIDGRGGLLESAKPGTLLVIHSTVRVETCKNIARLALERRIRTLEAPVSGGAIGARAATLSVMVGGEPADLEACRPVLSSFCKTILHIGDIGTAQLAKLANNLVLLVNLEGIREALQLATLGGISEEKLMEVLRASSGNSWRIEHWEEQKKVVQNYMGGPAGIAKTRAKDLSLALAEGRRLGASLPVTALVAERTTLPNDN